MPYDGTMFKSRHPGWRGALLGIALGVLVLAPPAFAASQASREQISREYAQQVERRYPVVDDPAQTWRLSQIMQRLLPTVNADGYSWRVRILESAQPNAFSLPNGFIYVNTGLLTLRCEVGPARSGDPAPPPEITDDELAFVLGHEMAHVTQDHVMRMNETGSSITRLLSRALPVGPLGGLVFQGLNRTVTSGFSREFETEADHLGLQTAGQAGYDPWAALTLLRRLQILGQAAAKKVQPFPSHPATASRAANVQKWLATMPPPHRPAGSLNGPLTAGLPVIWVVLPPEGPVVRSAPALKEAPQVRVIGPDGRAGGAKTRVGIQDVPALVGRRLVTLREVSNLWVKPVPGDAWPLPTDPGCFVAFASRAHVDATLELQVDRFDQSLMPWPGGAVARVDIALTAILRNGADGSVMQKVAETHSREGMLDKDAAATREQLLEMVLDELAQRVGARLEKTVRGIRACAAPPPPTPPPPPMAPFPMRGE